MNRAEMNKSLAALSVFLLLRASGAMGQTNLTGPLTVPLFDEDVSFRVPLTAFDQTNYFLLDTGTSATALDLQHRERLGVPFRQWDGHDFYRSPELRFGNNHLAITEVFCADLKMFRLITGEPCDGILGMDFLKNHLLEVDFDRSLVSIGGHLSEQIKKTAWGVPLSLSNKRHFTIPAVLNGKVKLNLLIDTADSSTVSLNQADWDKVFPPGDDSPMYKALLAGVGKKTTESRMARLRSLQIAGQTYSNLICPRSVFSAAPSGIGVGFLRRHLVTLDFPNQMLYLRPGKQFQTEDEHDMSGLHLLRDQGSVLVHSVDEGSPAANAGVQAGDRIALINNVESRVLKMKHIRAILKLDPDEKILLVINRGEASMQMEFRLKRFL
jgi:hypothetical protein